jgi:hypothetical protein
MSGYVKVKCAACGHSFVDPFVVRLCSTCSLSDEFSPGKYYEAPAQSADDKVKAEPLPVKKLLSWWDSSSVADHNYALSLKERSELRRPLGNVRDYYYGD